MRRRGRSETEWNFESIVMRSIAFAAVALLALAGCSPSPYGGNGYSASSCGAAPGVIGGLAGAGGGALLGNQFGHGTGKDVTTGLGALAGGAGGYTAGNALSGC